jgi:hypothetical protein
VVFREHPFGKTTSQITAKQISYTDAERATPEGF